MRKEKGHIIFFLISLIIFFGGCATGGQAKKDVTGPELTIIKDINISDNRIEIKGDRPFVYTAYKPADPFRVVVEIPEADIGKFKDTLKSTSRGITEIISSQIESPKPIARFEILLDTPVSFEQSYHNNVLTLNLREEPVAFPAPEVKAAVYHAPAQDKAKEDVITVPSDKEVVIAQNTKEDEPSSTKEMTAGVQPPVSDMKPLPKATEIKDIRIDKVNGTLKLIITGNGSMSPSIFTLKNRIVIDIPDVSLKATLPSDLISPIKNIRAGKHKDKTRIVLDMKELKEFDAVSIKDSIMLTLGIPEAIALKTVEPLPKAEIVKKETEVRVAEATQPEALVEGRYTGKKISLDFQDADIVPIFRLLADISGYNIVVDPNVKGKLTMKLINVPWDQALELILKTFDLDTYPSLEDILKGKSNVIRIASRDKIKKEIEDSRKIEEIKEKEEEKKEPLETRVFKLNYASAEDIKRKLLAIEKEVGAAEKDQAKARRGLSYKREAVVFAGYQPGVPLISERGSVVADIRTNIVTVTDLPKYLAKIEEFIKEIDQPTKQVLIESRIVEVNTAIVRDLGIQWGVNLNATNTLTSIGGLSGLGTGPFTGGNYIVDFPGGASAGSGSGFTFGILNPARTMGLDLQLSAVETTGKGKIISNPKILTLDGVEAKISQGDSIPIRKLTTEGTISTEFKDYTLEMTVSPTIRPNDAISMKITIKKEEPDWTRVSAEGTPASKKREAVTEVEIKDGETFVIGGVLKTSRQDSNSGVPGLMNIPVLGWLFKNKKTTEDTSEMLIFITPRIVIR